jgi:nuclear pore complex protein Nup160
VGLLEKVERELIWKAECSDITAKPNPYKLLYAFYMYRQNWRRAADYIYRYTVRLKEEGVLKVHLQLSFTLRERLQGLTAAINALHLVDPAYAWVDFQQESSVRLDWRSPSKRARTFMDENSVVPIQKEIAKQYQPIDIEQLENEYVLTLAHLQLAVANVKHSSLGGDILPSDLVVLLVQSNLYEMAFTVIFKFWRDSSLKRELEKVVQIMAQKCCTSKSSSSLMKETPANVLLIPSSAREDQTDIDILSNNFQTVQHTNSKTAWHVLQLYLEKYKGLHSRLPVVAAETLLCTDPQIELPLWLVDMFKGGRRATAWGMAGQESDPAALFRLYIEYGRFSDATHLLLEYLEAWASLRPADIIKRKKMSAVWFPYTSVERLYGLLSEMRSSGQMIDQCDKLQKLLHSAMLRHLKQMKVDSDDVKSSAL